MNNLDAVKEVFFLKELGYTDEIIADKLDGILYDMAVDYYTSAESGYYRDEEYSVRLEEFLNELELTIINSMEDNTVPTWVSNLIKLELEKAYDKI